jgi:peptidyl-tRNA hydrolase, PTH1 family
MYIIVGLGNPGKKYEATRHNIGFMAIDQIADKYNISVDKERMKAYIGEGNINGEKVVLVKPQTYMNLSGEAVGALARWYKVEPEHIITIYDDMDIEVGRIRIRKQGRAGGHNGIKSLIQHLGTENFPRVKLGIGRPNIPGMNTADYVLGVIPKEEVPRVEEVLEAAVNSIEYALEHNIDLAMNKFN